MKAAGWKTGLQAVITFNGKTKSSQTANCQACIAKSFKKCQLLITIALIQSGT